MKMKNVLLIFVLFLVNLTVDAQPKSEFLVWVDYTTGTFTKIDSLPSVRWIPTGGAHYDYKTFDSNNKRFIFKGLDASNHPYLYTVDSRTGDILYNPPHPNTGDTLDDFVQFHYDVLSNNLYGIFLDHSVGTSVFYFAKMDQITGNITPIKLINNIIAMRVGDGCSAFDSNNGWYTFIGIDSSWIWKLITIDANTGNILYSPNCPLNYVEFQYDLSTDTMYALLLSGSNPTFLHIFGNLNIVNGNFQIIDTIPNVVDALASCLRFSTFDSNHKRYFFRGGDGNGNWNLYTIDATTGNVAYSPPYPLPPINPLVDNVIQLQYDNSSDTLYALHWGLVGESAVPEIITQGYILQTNPNPFSLETTLKTNDNLINATLTVYNSLGQQVKQIRNISGQTITLHRDNLPSGLYLLRLTQDNKTFATDKIVITEN